MFILCMGLVISSSQLKSAGSVEAYEKNRENMASAKSNEEGGKRCFRAMNEELQHHIGAQFTAAQLAETQEGSVQARDMLLAEIIYGALSSDTCQRYMDYTQLSEEQQKECRNVMRQRLSLALAVYPVCRQRETTEELWLLMLLSWIYAVNPDAVAEAVADKANNIPENRKLPLTVVTSFHSGKQLTVSGCDEKLVKAGYSALRTIQRLLRERSERRDD